MKSASFSRLLVIGCLIIAQSIISGTPPPVTKGKKHMNKIKVHSVDSVELAILKSNPPKLSIKASGRVPTAGWSMPELVPYVYVQAPPDGIYDFDFVAQSPPPDSIVAQVVSPISASHVLEKIPTGLRGVRIHAASNKKEALLREKSR